MYYFIYMKFIVVELHPFTDSSSSRSNFLKKLLFVFGRQWSKYYISLVNGTSMTQFGHNNRRSHIVEDEFQQKLK